MLSITTRFRRSIVLSVVVMLLLSSVQSLFARSTTEGEDAGAPRMLYLPVITQGKAANPGSSVDVFAIQPGTDAWAQLETHDAMVAASQVPLATLQEMSTDTLVETVLRYPLFGDMLAYDSPQKGFEVVAAGFDGFIELFNRTDAGAKLLAKYQTMDPATVSASATLEEQGDYDRQFTFVEALLAHDAIQAKFSDTERSTLVTEALKKFEAKQAQAEIYGHFGRERSALLLGRTVKNAGVNAASAGATQAFLQDATIATPEVLQAIVAEAQSYLGLPGSTNDSVGAAATEDYYETVYTPRGSAVTVIVMTYELSSSQISASNAWVARNYPRAARLSNASRRYNCHSYAWYLASTSNIRWMNSPGDDRYMNDGSYRYLGWAPGTYVAAVPNGTRVSYPSASDHSAIKVSNSGFYSKWGQLPIMSHFPNYSPYGASRLYYYYR